MKNPKLKACPFCGSQPESKEIIYTGFPIFQWEVKCQRCRCATAHSYKTQKDAETKWNVRAGDRQPMTPETVSVKALASATCSPAREHVMSHIAQATAQMRQAEAALRDFGDDGKNCAALIQHLRYQLHKYKGLVPENADLSHTPPKAQ
jgi:hypothetical protein